MVTLGRFAIFEKGQERSAVRPDPIHGIADV